MASRYIVVGLSDAASPRLPEAVDAAMAEARLFAGGRRHYQRIRDCLPPGHVWLDLDSGWKGTLQALKAHPDPVVLFTSGDPLFYGLAETLLRFDPEAVLDVHPRFHSLQTLCHRLALPYRRLSTVSVHGRSWQELDAALIEDRELIGVLTDAVKSPAAIAERMLAYGFRHYVMAVGECLEGEGERVLRLSLEEAAVRTFQDLNCLLLMRGRPRPRPFGIPDDRFERLPGREALITKMPLRLAALSRLDLGAASCFWDIGSCTGSVSIEAKLGFPHLQVVAFEKRPECAALLHRNARALSTPGLQAVVGDFLEQDPAALPRPEAVFVGGHGNRLAAVLERVHAVLPPGGRIAMNAVREENRALFESLIVSYGYHMQPPLRIVVDEHNPVTLIAGAKPSG